MISCYDKLKAWIIKENADMNGNLHEEKFSEWLDEVYENELMDPFGQIFGDIMGE